MPAHDETRAGLATRPAEEFGINNPTPFTRRERDYHPSNSYYGDPAGDAGDHRRRGEHDGIVGGKPLIPQEQTALFPNETLPIFGFRGNSISTAKLRGVAGVAERLPT